MAKLLMLPPADVVAIVASRGVGGANLLTPDPKEVWADTAVAADVTIDIDFGDYRDINTVFLGSIGNVAPAGALWAISGGAGYTAIPILAATALKAPAGAGQSPAISHAFWNGATYNLRYLRITLYQPAGSPPLTAGVVAAGLAFVSAFGQEWGAGRKVIDTGTATPLPSGGFAVIEGARKASYSWTFGDLSSAEVDTLYALQLDRGETRPLLVVEDPAQTTGLRWRLHYGKLASLRQYERRRPTQTRWELTIEEWI